MRSPGDTRTKPKVLLVGPCPPPDGGTTIPFRLFCDFVMARYASRYRFSIVNANTGSKADVALLAPGSLTQTIPMISRVIRSAFSSQRIIVFGSQRFITLVGSLLLLILAPFGKKIHLRINGGGYDQFWAQLRKRSRRFVSSAFNNAESIVVQTLIVESAMREEWGETVRAISNYRPLVDFDMESRKFEENRVRFIYTGVVRKTKGCRELLEAFDLLVKKIDSSGLDVEVSLDVFGRIHSSRSEPLDLNEFMSRDDVVFHGPVEHAELQAWYASSDVFLFPSYWPTEGHPGAVIEAMMYGLPVIASRWRAIPEVVEEEVSGLLCPVGDVEALSALMFQLATDIDRRRELSRAAFVRAKSFDSEVVCPRLAANFGLHAD